MQKVVHSSQGPRLAKRLLCTLRDCVTAAGISQGAQACLLVNHGFCSLGTRPCLVQPSFSKASGAQSRSVSLGTCPSRAKSQVRLSVSCTPCRWPPLWGAAQINYSRGNKIRCRTGPSLKRFASQSLEFLEAWVPQPSDLPLAQSIGLKAVRIGCNYWGFSRP